MSSTLDSNFKQIVDVSTSPVFIIDDKYTIEYCNNSFAELVGVKKSDDVISKSSLDFLPSEEQKTAKQRLNQAISEGYAAGGRELEIETITGKRKRVTSAIASLENNRALVSLDNVREIDEEQLAIEERKEQVKKLHEATLRISQATTDNEVYSEIIDAVENIVDIDYSLIGVAEDGMLKRETSTANIPEYGYEEPEISEENKRKYRAMRCYLDQETIITNDMDKVEEEKIEFDAAIHVSIGEYGIINAGSYQKYTFTEEDAKLLEILASQAEAALNRIEREAELNKQKKKVEKLHSIGVELAEQQSIEGISELMVDAGERILDLEYCNVVGVEDGQFRLAAKSDALPKDGLHEPPIDSEKAGVAGKAYRNNESIVVDDAQEHTDANPQAEYRSVLTVPIGEFGVFQANSYKIIGFNETDRQLAELLAEHVEKALSQRKQEEQLRQQRNEIELLQQVFSRIFRHNVKNELQVIRGNGQMIESTADSESVSHGAEILLEATERLIDATEKAREIENVVQERRDVQSGSLRRMVSTAVSDYKQEYPESEIIDDVEDIEVSAIIGLEEAIQNAVENALQHNPEPVSIQLFSEVSEETVKLCIKDNGDGIPEDELEVLSQEGETALKHGSGVGLWLMKWAVEKSDGKLLIENVDNGTRVEMSLPRV